MTKVIHLEPRALETAFRVTGLGARPTVVAALLNEFDADKVADLCRTYAKHHSLASRKGPMPDYRLTRISQRIFASAGVSLFKRMREAEESRVEAMLQSYLQYQRLTVHLRDTPDQLGFDRFYTVVRAFENHELKMKSCGACGSEYLVAVDGSMRSGCVFCDVKARSLAKPRLGQLFARDQSGDVERGVALVK